MHRNIKLLAFFNFFTDFKFHAAILVLYFAKISGSFALAMSLFSTIMLSSAVFEIPTGIFSDMIGRKKTVVLGSISAIISAIFYAIGANYWILFIGAIFEGLSRSWYSGNNDALLHNTLRDLGNPEEFSHYLGRISSMFQIALAIAAVSGSIIANWSYAWVMWLSVIPQIICFIISLQIIEPKSITPESGNVYAHLLTSIKYFWKNKNLRLISLQDIIAYGIGESTFDFRAAFINTIWPLWAIGVAKTLSYIGGALGFWFSGKIIKKIGIYKILVVAKIYNWVINFLSVVFVTVLSPLSMGATSIFYGATSIATNTLMQKEFTEKERATMGSVNSFFGNIFFGIFSIILGLIADFLNPAKALIFASICSLPVIYINYLLMQRNKIYAE